MRPSRAGVAAAAAVLLIALAGMALSLWVLEERSTTIRPARLSLNHPLTDWLACGPFPMEGSPGHVALDHDFLSAIGGEWTLGLRPFNGLEVREGGERRTWRPATVRGGSVAFDEMYGKAQDAAAYAWTEFKLSESATAWLGVGSDDAVRIWLNGFLVHDRYVLRGVVPDDDLVPVVLQAGVNTVLVKVFNHTVDWGFRLRFMDRDEALRAAAFNGNVPAVATLLAAGADPNRPGPGGWTPLLAAAWKGRLDAAHLLLRHRANPNSGDVIGVTPLVLAVRRGWTRLEVLLRARGATAPPWALPRSAQVDDLCVPYARGNRPGVAVAVVDHGRVVHCKGYGLARLWPRIVIGPDTRFPIGSLTKQFVAMAIMILVEEGRLRLDDRITRWVPEFPRKDSRIRLDDLLHHTSGISKWNVGRPRTGRLTASEFAGILNVAPADCPPPRTRFQYTNLGYDLLGYAVERASGMPIEAFMARRMFRPLGMTRTLFEPAGWGRRWGQAWAYQGDTSGWASARVSSTQYLLGGTGLISTAADLARWAAAWEPGKLVRAETLAQAFRPARLRNGSVVHYGFGWGLVTDRGLRVESHSGWTTGYHSCLRRYPGDQLTVVVLANSDPFPSEELAAEIAEVYLGGRMRPRD